MFMDGVDEFYKCLMESINHVLRNEDKDLNVSTNIILNEFCEFYILILSYCRKH